MCLCSIDVPCGVSAEKALVTKNATFSLLLPGKILNLTALSQQRKFKGRGNKPGAVKAWILLHEDNLGTMKEIKARRGTDKASVYANVMTIYRRFQVGCQVANAGHCCDRPIR